MNVLPPTSGRLVYYGEGDVRLASDAGDIWPVGSYSIKQGFGGGATVMPRPWVYDETGTGGVIVKGDKVIIEFLNGRWETPIVAGIVRTIGETDTLLDYDYRTGNIGNVRRLSLRYIELDGTEVGSVTMQVNETGGDVSWTQSANMQGTIGGDLTLTVTGSVNIDGATINLGSASLDKVCLEALVAAELSVIDNVFNTWVPIANDGGAALQLAWQNATATGWPGTMGSSKVNAET